MEQVPLEIDLYRIEHLFRTYRGCRHSQYTGLRLSLIHILTGLQLFSHGRTTHAESGVKVKSIQHLKLQYVLLPVFLPAGQYIIQMCIRDRSGTAITSAACTWWETATTRRRKHKIFVS